MAICLKAPKDKEEGPTPRVGGMGPWWGGAGTPGRLYDPERRQCYRVNGAVPALASVGSELPVAGEADHDKWSSFFVMAIGQSGRLANRLFASSGSPVACLGIARARHTGVIIQ